MHHDDVIPTRQVPVCRLCGERGEIMHRDLVDWLFGAPGRWTLKRCPNGACGLVWLDPMPTEDGIARAYVRYYTHRPESGDTPAPALWMERMLRRLSKRVKRGRRERAGMYLDKTPPGRLLDVGCGNGGFLARMAARGWRVEGQEVDVEAAESARTRHGFTVHLGPLHKLRLPSDGYDAIAMQHVIEHVHEPEKLVAECRRLLRDGGQLIVVTPNIKSLGHKLFGRSWRGLEPPRHLHLFSGETLKELAKRCGFGEPEVWTASTNAGALAAASVAARGATPLNAPKRIGLAVLEAGVQSLAGLVHIVEKDSGDECVLKAVK